MSSPAPPRSLNDMTAEWLSAVLDAPIAAARATPIAVGEGFTGQLARIDLDYGGDPPAGRPTSVIGKLPSTEPGAVALGQLLRLWEREARFYRDVAPTLPVRTAQCFYADGYAEDGRWSLVLEDLSFARCGDQVAGTSGDDADRAVDWLAAFHATWWGRDDEAFDWLPRVKTDPMYQALQPMLEAVFPQFADKFGGDVPATALAWTEQAVPQLGEELSTELFPPTIIHSDYRLDNMFFGDGEVIPIDWQALAVGQAMYDVAYFIGNCVPTDDRRANERHLVERWRVGLERAGVDMPTAQETFDRYRQGMFLVMLVGALLYGQLDFTVNERAGSLARTCANRVFTAAVDLGAGEFVR